MEGLELGENDHIKVYKANMIIPQIAENLTRSGTCSPIAHCPACGGATEVRLRRCEDVILCESVLQRKESKALFSLCES